MSSTQQVLAAGPPLSVKGPRRPRGTAQPRGTDLRWAIAFVGASRSSERRSWLYAEAVAGLAPVITTIIRTLRRTRQYLVRHREQPVSTRVAYRFCQRGLPHAVFRRHEKEAGLKPFAYYCWLAGGSALVLLHSSKALGHA